MIVNPLLGFRCIKSFLIPDPPGTNTIKIFAVFDHVKSLMHLKFCIKTPQMMHQLGRAWTSLAEVDEGSYQPKYWKADVYMIYQFHEAHALQHSIPV